MVLDEEGIAVKMSKSLGNFITIREMLTRARPEALRAFILGAHYSNPVTWSEDVLTAASAGQERLFGGGATDAAAPEHGGGERGRERLPAAPGTRAR